MWDVLKTLEKNGWEITCKSPFEIEYLPTKDTATGYAAQIIAQYLHDNEEEE